jgi:hypothetical protein
MRFPVNEVLFYLAYFILCEVLNCGTLLLLKRSVVACNRTIVLKGTVSRDGYFFEGLNILISTFCVCAEGFQDLSNAFHYPLQLLTFIYFFEIY